MGYNSKSNSLAELVDNVKSPYIGICDFQEAEEVSAMADILRQNRTNPDRRLMAGLMMGRYQITGEPVPAKLLERGGIFPKNEDVADIFINDPDVMNTIHYADWVGTRVEENLEKAIAYGGPNLHALQLDMKWPDPQSVRDVMDRHPTLEMVLQVGRDAFKEVDQDPAKMVDKLREYGGALDYVFLDKSMGEGLGMDAEGLRPYLQEIRDELPDLGLAVAGGLGPETMHLLEPLVSEFPGISIDAQGQLRYSGSDSDPIDWDRAKSYLTQASRMLD